MAVFFKVRFPTLRAARPNHPPSIPLSFHPAVTLESAPHSQPAPTVAPVRFQLERPPAPP